MKCPKCQTEIGSSEIHVFNHEDSAGIELYFACTTCLDQFFAILTPRTFVKAD